jgi:TM2 domain-containing membrane protein YozV/predicted nuclease with TOPRIM domain
MGVIGNIIDAFETPRKKKKEAYASLIFLGFLGWHQFYLGKRLRGILYIVGLVCLLVGWRQERLLLAGISGGILLAFWLFDLFTLGRQVNKWNMENAGNSLLTIAGEMAGGVISIPLNNAVEEYNGIVTDYKNTIKEFKKKKKRVELLLQQLQQARKDAASVVTRIQQIFDNIKAEERKAVLDELGETGKLSKIITKVISGNEEIFNDIQETIDTTSNEIKNTFYAAQEITKEIESSAGKFAAAAAMTVISGIKEYSKQQEKIAELKQKRENILEQQNKIEVKIRQLEATKTRGEEILKVIEGELPGFDHIYNTFCAAVFPDGTVEQKDRKSLAQEQRLLLKDLVEAAKKVMVASSQEIN